MLRPMYLHPHPNESEASCICQCMLTTARNSDDAPHSCRQVRARTRTFPSSPRAIRPCRRCPSFPDAIGFRKCAGAPASVGTRVAIPLLRCRRRPWPSPLPVSATLYSVYSNTVEENRGVEQHGPQGDIWVHAPACLFQLPCS